MAKGKDLRKELTECRFEYELLQKIPCSNKENKSLEQLLANGGTLPNGIYPYVFTDGTPTGEFYTIYIPDLTESEKQEYLTYKKLSMLSTIKNCAIFFTVLTILGIITAIIILLSENA